MCTDLCFQKQRRDWGWSQAELCFPLDPTSLRGILWQRWQRKTPDIFHVYEWRPSIHRRYSTTLDKKNYIFPIARFQRRSRKTEIQQLCWALGPQRGRSPKRMVKFLLNSPPEAMAKNSGDGIGIVKDGIKKKGANRQQNIFIILSGPILFLFRIVSFH